MKRTSWNKGIPMAEDVKRKVSQKLTGFKRPPFTKKHRKKLSLAKVGTVPWMKGRKHTSDANERNRLKHLGTKRSHAAIEKFRRSHSKEKHWNWKGGISKNPYPKEFTPALKLRIRERDMFRCCLCGKTEREELEDFNRVLCVNHIDFDKNNCSESNLNTLCTKCNVRICREREYWTNFFQNEQ